MLLSRRTLLAHGALASSAFFIHGIHGCTPRTRDARRIERVVSAVDHVDGAGVKLKKLLGSRTLPLLDPFLMLDGFRSKNPDDFVRGFPNHPHRGFETVSIVLDGHVRHADSVGNRGDITGGGVQWMTAGRGIVHSEMLAAGDASGELFGYQLWVNLPAKEKMTRPRYQDLAASAIPVTNVGDARVRVLAGAVGATHGPVADVVSRPTLLDVTLEKGARFVHAIDRMHNAFFTVANGRVRVGDATVGANELAALTRDGDVLDVVADESARVLVFAGAPIGEPVARRGPFVMNTQAELDQAYADYRSGRLVDG